MVSSKLQGIFTIGRPFILVGYEGCAMGEWVVPPGDLQALEKALHESLILKNRKEKNRDARDYGEHHFQAKNNAQKVATELVNQERATLKFSKNVFQTNLRTESKLFKKRPHKK